MPDLPLAPELSSTQEYEIDREIRAGLPNHQRDLADRLHVLSYYDLGGSDHLHCEDEGEPHRKTHPLTRRTIDVLTSKTYSNPPTRSILDDERSQAFIDEAYRDNSVDDLFQVADEMATLLGFSAIYAAPTEDSLKPVKLYVYDATQLVVFADEGDCTRIAHVVVISRFDQKTTYTWWSKDFKRTYRTKKAEIGLHTAGGRTADYVEDESHANVYGRLPFGFIHARRPTSTPTVPGLGHWLAEYNHSIDATMLDQALAIRHFYLPKAWVSGAPAEWQPTSTRDGEFMRLPQTITGMDKSSQTAQIGYLQAELQVDQGTIHIESLINQALAGIGVPRSMYSLDSTSFASGDAIEQEQAPLVDYTLKRRRTLSPCEGDVAEAVLAVAGGWFGDQALSEAGQGGVNLTLRWPDLGQPPTPEQDRQDLEQGVRSLVDIVQRKYGYTSEEEAVQHLLKIKEDNDRLRQLGIFPEAATPQENAV
jgi:hypothetical protein